MNVSCDLELGFDFRFQFQYQNRAVCRQKIPSLVFSTKLSEIDTSVFGTFPLNARQSPRGVLARERALSVHP